MVMRKNRIWQRVMGGLLFFALFSAFFVVGAPEKENLLLTAAREENEGKETFFELTQEEEDYLAQLRGQLLFVGISGFGVWGLWDGMDCGSVVPLVDVLHYEFGLELRLVQGNWEENRTAMQDGSLDLLVGVPTVQQGGTEEDGLPVLRESGLYCSAWLYENPYAIVEYTGEVTGGEAEIADSAGKKSTVLVYVEGDPVCEELLPNIMGMLGLYIEGASSADSVELLSFKDEDAVFAALESGRADIAILPEEALFLRYPALDFSVTAHLGVYGSRAAVGIADQRLIPLIEILNRYLETTEEGDALRMAMRVQQQAIWQKKIWEQEREILQNLMIRGENLLYAQAGLDAVPFFWHDENGAYGELPDFLDFVSGCTGLVFKESPLFGEEALQALEEGELLFVAGMPFLGNGQAYCFAGAYTASRLIPVIPAADVRQFRQEDVTSRYWGVAQELMPLLRGTVFDGHVVEFADERMLYEAMRAGEVGGMLIMEESLDALLLSGEEAYAMVQGIAFPFKSGLAFSEEDWDTAGFFGRMCQFYSLFRQEQTSSAEQYRTAYAQVKEAQEGLNRMVWILGTVVLVLAVAFLLALHRKKK